MNIGNFLRTQRERQRLTRAEVAKICGYSQALIYSYEIGKAQPTLYKLDKILNAINTDLVLGVNSDLRNKYLK